MKRRAWVGKLAGSKRGSQSGSSFKIPWTLQWQSEAPTQLHLLFSPQQSRKQRSNNPIESSKHLKIKNDTSLQRGLASTLMNFRQHYEHYFIGSGRNKRHAARPREIDRTKQHEPELRQAVDSPKES
jgi:hypothetical protein